ncbi:hypothetical protein [Chitinimonas naiadis]
MRLYFLIAFSLLLACTSAQAATPYKLVGYKCDRALDELVLSYYLSPDPPKADTGNPSEGAWDPWSLVTAKDNTHIGDLQTVERQCRLSDGLYQVVVGPEPGNYDKKARCGDWMTAWSKISQGARVISEPRSFETGCQATNGQVVTRLVIKGGNKKPVVKTVPYEKFYD